MIDEIYEEIKKRNITRLCHFVHTNILLHILNNNEGVKAVDFIKQDVLIQNDKQRLDGKTDYINCSVQYPNWWYLRRVKDNNPTVIWDAIEVGLSGLPLRNVLWNCAAVPEGFAVWLCCGM